jgi:hypothetical protein
MRCKNCGWENPDEHAECEKCGNRLSAAAAPAKSTVPGKYESKKTAVGCPHCGYPLRPGDPRCPHCNNPTTDPPAVGVPAKPPVGACSAALSPVVSGGTHLPGMDGANSDARRLVGLLVTYSLNPLGEYFPVYEGKNSVGRDGSANIRLNGDALVSGKHLTVLYRAVDKKFKFKDEQSSNGTFVNEKLTDEGELASGDIIRIGDTKLLFIAIPEF